MFTKSILRPGEIVIDDDNAPPAEDVTINGEHKSRGRLPREYWGYGYGETPYTAKFDLAVIPRSEWAPRIEEMEKTKTRISDISDQAGLPCKDQNGTNYCWINAPVHCMEIARVVQGQPMIQLSPASVGAQIKNFRNQGGWGLEGLKYIAEHGVAPSSMWPDNAIKREYLTDAVRTKMRDFITTEWWELKDRSFDQMMTCLFMRFPVAVGYNWWSHEVTAVDPVYLGGDKFGIRIRNSWGMKWGDKGYSVLTESKGTPDDAVVARTAMPVAA